MTKSLLSLLLSLLLFPFAHPLFADLYVATTGDDANPGTLEKPLATVARARDRIRALREDQHGPVTIHVRGGTYYLSEPLVFTAEDCGSGQAPIVYRAYADERPTLTGGVPLQAAWTQHRT